MRLFYCSFIAFILFASCDYNEDASIKLNEFQTISLMGDSLFIPKRSKEANQILLMNLKEAENQFKNDPSEKNYIWLGRRWAYVGDYRKAISIYSDGLKKYPQSYRLHRHRGHRYVSLREFDLGIKDFKLAYDLMPKDKTEIEPDGIPNKLNQPLSNTQFNVMYHWGLAHYLKGEFDKALPIYKECMKYSVNNDLLIATSDWLYMTLMRLQSTEAATQLLSVITSNMEIVENASYHKRLLMYKQELPIDSLFSTQDSDRQLSLITQGYGVANWYLYNKDTTSAINLFKDILKSPAWSPFGYIAAESDLASLSE